MLPAMPIMPELLFLSIYLLRLIGSPEVTSIIIMLEKISWVTSMIFCAWSTKFSLCRSDHFPQAGRLSISKQSAERLVDQIRREGFFDGLFGT